MIYGHLLPSAEARAEAGKALRKILLGEDDDETRGLWLQEHMCRRAPGAEGILAADVSDGSTELPYRDLPNMLVDMFGNEIFEGEEGAVLRDRILDRLLELGLYRQIFGIFFSTVRVDDSFRWREQIARDPTGTARRMASALKNHKRYHWRPGKSYARSFVKELGLDDAFAGIPSEHEPERVEEAVPRAEVHALESFQENMKAQILQMLKSTGKRRAIVTLPTGAGKTRIVVEAAVDFLNEHGSDRNLLWIAHSEEVCEQAVLCFKQMWEHRGRGKTLDIFRAWGSNELPGPDERGVIVGGVQKLYKRKHDLDVISDDGILSAVFIDEAHHSVAKSYADILEGLDMSPFPDGTRTNDATPLIGLTATPTRRQDHETTRLRRMYGETRIFPRPSFEPPSSNGVPFDENWQNLDFMRKKLTDLEYLAKATFHLLAPGRPEIHLTEEEDRYLERGDDKWMSTIAVEAERNRNIKNAILEWAEKGKKILYFGTNVAQSNAMAGILSRAGIASSCITGKTRYATRRILVDAFNKSKEIQVLCNYNVLSTGFDSPQIDTVIIARPTTSVVSYQQMVGRGLRGARFGGRHQCDIVTVEDNITKFNHERVDLAYQRFSKDAIQP